jgi:hypothetical protein
MAASAPILPEELSELVASGVDVYVATRDAELEPESMLAMGIRLHRERDALTVYLPVVTAAPTRKNLDTNAEIAVTLIRPSDLKAVQLKGKSVGIRPSTENDREFQSIFRSALIEQMVVVGVPRCATRRLAWWPSLAVEVRVREVFLQTPGPAAGEPLVGR